MGAQTDPISENELLEALRGVSDPTRDGNVVDLGTVSNLSVKDGVVRLTLEVKPEEASASAPLREACESAISKLPGVRTVQAVLTSHSKTTDPPDSSAGSSPQTGQSKLDLPGVAAVVAVASGKGGVGKSTTAVNLALGLAAKGLAIGILDADVYGPSIPRMLGIEGRKPEAQERMLVPLETFGVRAMSMGFLVPGDTPMIWRGPMVTSALNQLLHGVRWGNLDVLVVDFPPGTGDAHLTMAQRAPLTGAVIVSTPQDIALQDARKGVRMFEKVQVPVFGLVENMSYFLCPHCRERSEIFGHGGARNEAEQTGTPFLGEIPLDIRIRETSDAGTPIVILDPESVQSKAYLALADNVSRRIEEAHSANVPTRIIVD